jgi:hypothetical protein
LPPDTVGHEELPASGAYIDMPSDRLTGAARQVAVVSCRSRLSADVASGPHQEDRTGAGERRALHLVPRGRSHLGLQERLE